MNKKHGFTLAEILITLGIIGVVAAMTIPTILSNIQDIQYKSALKKNYSIFSNVFTQIQNEYSGFQNAAATCTNGDHTCFKNLLKKYLSYSKECNNGSTQGICFHSQMYKYDGSAADSSVGWGNPAGLILNDGTLVDIYFDSSTCAVTRGTYTDECGWITIDINGFKLPNAWGKDIYNFMFYKDRIRPMGTDGDGYSCVVPTAGYGCAAKYLSN